MANNITTVSGIVQQVNKSGFLLDNGNWLNFSQYGYRGPEHGQPAPSVGQHITAQVKNDKFLHTLMIGDTPTQAVVTPSGMIVTPAREMSLPTPATTTTTPVVADMNIVGITMDVRQTILKTMAVAQPAMFTLENLDTLTEIVRNLEQFVLEDLNTKPDADADVTADDLLDEDI